MSDIVNRLRFDFRDRDADEVEEMQQEIDRLRAQLAQRTAEVAKANAERDAARRMYCVEMSRQSSEPKKFTPEWGARLFGWDCFDAKGAKP